MEWKCKPDEQDAFVFQAILPTKGNTHVARSLLQDQHVQLIMVTVSLPGLSANVAISVADKPFLVGSCFPSSLR
jgi:hypothetical protein